MLCRRKVKRNNIWVCVESVALTKKNVLHNIISKGFGNIPKLLKENMESVMKLSKQEQKDIVETAMLENIGMSAADFGSEAEILDQMSFTFPKLMNEINNIYKINLSVIVK